MGEVSSLRYRAFLSYSHKDTNWAKWLHRRIEGFRVGRDVVGRETPMGPIPKTLRPVFRDRHDFDAGGTLREQTIVALDASAALVVVCSPASAKSVPVNEEVRQFIARHSDRPVIPLIVAGTPGDAENECFPRALRFAVAADGTITDQPADVLAADAREFGDGRELALAKVIARLIGLGPDEIYRRAERERRRRASIRNAVICALVLLTIAAGVSAAYAWQQLKTNEAFLDATLERFTSLVNRAVSLSRSYSVPLPVSLGILQEAEGMLDVMAKYGRDTPKLKYRQAQMLNAFANNYRDLGQTDEWQRRVEQAHSVMTDLVRADPNNLEWASELAVAEDNAGDLALAKSSLPEALKSYSDSLAILERLAKTDNAEWVQRDLSVSYNKVGNVLVALGNLPEALKSYSDSLAVAKRLAMANPTNPDRQRNLLVSYAKVGEALMEQGNLLEALTSFRDGLAIADRLTKADPNNAGWQRDLSASYVDIGRVLMAQGNLPEALKYFRDSLSIADQVTKADPKNAGWQSELAVSYVNIGDVLMAQGDQLEAMKSFRDSVVIRERLTTTDPNNASWQNDLSLSYERVGNALMAEGNLQDALKFYGDSLAIRDRLTKAAPNNAEWQAALAASYGRMGQLYRAMGQGEEALRMFRTGRAIVAPLAERSENGRWKQYLSNFDLDIAVMAR